MEYDADTDAYIFPCPHCELLVVVQKKEIACKIFRHGVFYKKQGEKIVITEQIPPHTKKEDCDHYVASGTIIGCGKPFQMVCSQEGKYSAQKCDYI